MELPLTRDTVSKALAALEDIRRSYAVPYSKRIKVPKVLGEAQRRCLLEQVETAEKQCADLAAVGEMLGRQLCVQLGTVEELGRLLVAEQMKIGDLSAQTRALEQELRETKVDREYAEKERREEQAGAAALERLVRELRLEIAALTVPKKPQIHQESQVQLVLSKCTIPVLTVSSNTRESCMAIEKLPSLLLAPEGKADLVLTTEAYLEVIPRRKVLHCETFHVVKLQERTTPIRRKIDIVMLSPLSILVPVHTAIHTEKPAIIADEMHIPREDYRKVEILPGLELPKGKLVLDECPQIALFPTIKPLQSDTFLIAEILGKSAPISLLCVSTISTIAIPSPDPNYPEEEALLELETCSLFTIYPEAKADPELFSCSICDLPPPEHDLAFFGFTICALGTQKPRELDICRVTCYTIPSPDKVLSVQILPNIEIKGFNYLQLFTESELVETTNKEETGPKRKHRLRPARKDPGEEYFSMCLQVLKLNHPDSSRQLKASPATLYAEALASSVPFSQVSHRQWGKWLKRTLLA